MLLKCKELLGVGLDHLRPLRMLRNADAKKTQWAPLLAWFRQSFIQTDKTGLKLGEAEGLVWFCEFMICKNTHPRVEPTILTKARILLFYHFFPSYFHLKVLNDP